VQPTQEGSTLVITEKLVTVYPPVLDALRRRRGLSVRALARLSGINHTTLAAVLNGRAHSTSENNVWALARVLKVDPELITVIDNPHPADKK
jgi:transcriptional regulator with XRE-family HTH domain